MRSGESQFWSDWAKGCVGRSILVCLTYSDKAVSKIDWKFEEEEDAVEVIARRDVGVIYG